MKIKIYLILIAAFTILLVYLNVSSEPGQPTANKNGLPETVSKKHVVPGEPIKEAYVPKFKPKTIPYDVLTGSKENDFYYYLFVNPNRKTVFYIYQEKSTKPGLSEGFHKKVSDYLAKVVIYGNFKNYATTTDGAELYEKSIFKSGIWSVGKGLSASGKNEDIEKEMHERAKNRSAITLFIEECSKSMCIINAKTQEYVKIDKRDAAEAMKTLKDYERW